MHVLFLNPMLNTCHEKVYDMLSKQGYIIVPVHKSVVARQILYWILMS